MLLVLIVLLSSPIYIGCSNSTNTTKPKDNFSQQDIDNLFKKAEILFDEDKPEEAFNILKKLAEQGDAKSQNALGNGYQHGFWGGNDLNQAKYWYQKAADQSYVKGIHNLGMLEFLQGNYEQALPFFEKGASLNNAASINLLGTYYSEGIIFEKDYKIAFEYFSKAVDQNNRDAQFNIGQAYYYGKGVEQDYKLAFEWYVRSADQDYSLAQIQLAEMYFSGKGVNKNIAKAIEIIKPLAELGDPKAQRNLKWYIDHPN